MPRWSPADGGDPELELDQRLFAAAGGDHPAGRRAPRAAPLEPR